MALHKKNPYIKNILRPLVALIFMFILVKKGPFQLDQIQFILSQKSILFLGFFLFFIQFGITSLRWKVIVELLAPITLKLAFALTLIGHFFSFFIPGGVGGDVIKALELSKSKNLAKSQGLSTVFADRLLGLYSMVLFSFVFLLIDWVKDSSAQLFSYLSFSFFLLFTMTAGLSLGPMITRFLTKKTDSQNHKIFSVLQRLINAFNLTFICFRNPKILFKIFFLSLIIQCLSNYFMLEVVKALNVTPPTFFIFFSLSCFGFLASAIPITPAGIGVGQAAVYFLFSFFSTEMGHAAVTAISTLQIFYLFYAVVGGILFSTKPFYLKAAKETP